MQLERSELLDRPDLKESRELKVQQDQQAQLVLHQPLLDLPDRLEPPEQRRLLQVLLDQLARLVLLEQLDQQVQLVLPVQLELQDRLVRPVRQDR